MSLSDLQYSERKVYSQNGEDGVLECIFSTIGVKSGYFVEFGCEYATECNCRYLLEQGWQGLFMDGRGDSRNPMTVVHKEFITVENINELLDKYKVPEEFDLLSIDIDGNDYWVWRAIKRRPRVVVIEYNSHLAPADRKVIAYHPTFMWNNTDYFGASLGALEELGAEKGYTLVYCEQTGVNAFFVSSSELPNNFKFKPLEEIYRPPNFYNRGLRHIPDPARRMIDPNPERRRTNSMPPTTLRTLVGPVSKQFAEEHLGSARQEGSCLTFGEDNPDLAYRPGENWCDLVSRLPKGWLPDCIVLDLAYKRLPAQIWSAPIPIIGLAGDWPLHWHYYNQLSDRVERLWTDCRGAELFTKAGVGNVRALVPFGRSNRQLGPPPTSPREYDLLWVGNFNPAIHYERLRWVADISRLAVAHRIRIVPSINCDDARPLLERTRIAFLPSYQGTWDSLVAEALACGAVVVRDANVGEISGLTAGADYLRFTERDLEAVLQSVLRDDDFRRCVASSGQSRANEASSKAMWQRAIEGLRSEWADLINEVPKRLARAYRCHEFELNHWQALSHRPVDFQPEIDADDAGNRLMAAVQMTWSNHDSGVPNPAGLHELHQLQDHPQARLSAALHLGEAYTALKRPTEAISPLMWAESTLSESSELSRLALGPGPLKPGYDSFRVEWERAGWANPTDRFAEVLAKRRLLESRCQILLGGVLGEPERVVRAASMAPNLLPAVKAAGPASAIRHLQAAWVADPLNPTAAIQLAAAHELTGDFRNAMIVRSTSEKIRQLVSGSRDADQRDVRAKQARRRRIVWQGAIHSIHSFARVNREICFQLIERGHEVSIRTSEVGPNPSLRLPPELARCVNASLTGTPDLVVRHQWPPDMTTRSNERYVLIQPWEYGSLPIDWIPMANRAVEIWAYSQAIQNCYVESGIPHEKVAIVPLGINPRVFHPEAEPMPLPTKKTFKFLYVGGTITRKGFGLLLEAYTRAFTCHDDVCLIVKDVGVNSVYSGQTQEQQIYALRDRLDAPHIYYQSYSVDEGQMPGLYTACDCLVSPFRGEGFALPIVEAMACGLPVIVTGESPATDYCTSSTAYLISAARHLLPGKHIGDYETVNQPWFFEPSLEELIACLKEVVKQRENARAKGQRASQMIRSQWTWQRAAQVIEQRFDRILG